MALWALPLILIALAAYGWISRREVPADVNLKFTPLTALAGAKSFPVFSPDGRRFVFSWRPVGENKEHLYVKPVGPVGPGDPIQLTSAQSEDLWPAWSPDGKWIAFCRRMQNETFGIYVISAEGGAERKVAEGGPGVSWSPDGKMLALARVPTIASMAAGESGGISLLALESGHRRDLTVSHADTLPVFSPDGKWIAFMRRPSGVQGEIVVVRADGGPERQLASNPAPIRGITWTADSREVIFNAEGTSLLRIPVTGGEPRVITGTLRKGIFHPSTDTSGQRLAFAQAWTKVNIYLLAGPGFQGGAPGPFSQSAAFLSEGSDYNPAYSPDGERIAFVSNRSGPHVIWICRRDGSQAVPLTSPRAVFTGSPRWSPDGRRIAYDSWASGQSVIYVVEPGGAGPRLLTAEPEGSYMPSWSPDGAWIYFTCGRSGARQVCKLAAEGGDTIQLTHGGANEAIPSADGKLVYFTRKTANAYSIWSVPAGGGAERPVPELQKFKSIKRSWGVLKQGIYFMEETSLPLTVHFLSFETRKVTLLFTLPKDSLWEFPSLSLSGDGRYALVSQVDETINDLMMIENFR